MYRRNIFGKLVPVDKPFFTKGENSWKQYQDLENKSSEVQSQINETLNEDILQGKQEMKNYFKIKSPFIFENLVFILVMIIVYKLLEIIKVLIL